MPSGRCELIKIQSKKSGLIKIIGFKIKVGSKKKVGFKEAKSQENKLYQKIKNAHEAGKAKKAAYWTRQYLNSLAAKHVAVVTANGKLKKHRKRPKQELRDIAAKLDPWKGSEEKVFVNMKVKENNENEYRTTMDFGIENRGLQYLVGSALMAQADIHQCQYGTIGTSPAVEAVMKALSDGYVWIAEVDIKNCFPSLDGEALPGLLPLPRKVTEQIITSQSLYLYPGNLLSHTGYGSISEWEKDDCDHDPVSELLFEARQGIPQGSAVSSIVVEMLLAPVVGELSNIGKVAAYADNILVMAREEKDAVSMLKTLGAALKSHPAGPLKPHMKTPLGKHKSFDFLGYNISHKFGNWVAAPSDKNLAKFDSRYNHDLKKATNPSISPGVRKRTLIDLQRFVRTWTAAFSLWKKAKDIREKGFAKIKQVSKKFSIVKAIANSSIKVVPSDKVLPSC